MAMLVITVSGWDEVGGTDEGEMEVEEGGERWEGWLKDHGENW